MRVAEVVKEEAEVAEAVVSGVAVEAGEKAHNAFFADLVVVVVRRGSATDGAVGSLDVMASALVIATGSWSTEVCELTATSESEYTTFSGVTGAEESLEETEERLSYEGAVVGRWSAFFHGCRGAWGNN